MTDTSLPLRAVLTGDIAGSRDLPERIRGRLPEALRQASASAREHFPEAVTHPIDIFRGDSWQVLVMDAARALRVALFIRATLRSSFDNVRVDTRVAIGVGTVDFVPEKDISGGNGEAFRLSGMGLDEMGRSFRMAFAMGSSLPPSIAALMDVAAKLVDVQVVSWTQRQAYAVTRALLGMTQEEIGEAWMDRPISQQTVAQHLSSGGWAAIEHALSVTETVLANRLFDL